MLRDLNLNESARRVLDVIWRHGPIARVDIGPLTRLSTMSVTRITRELSDLGLLIEDVRRDGGRGQPARPLMLRADAALSAGVYFSTGFAHVGLIDLSGALLEHERIIAKPATPEELGDLTIKAIERFLKRRGFGSENMAGVGFAMPGDFIVDRQRLNTHALFPGFVADDVTAALQARSPFQIFVENDAACAALGERLLGVGQTIDNFFFTHIGHGIGGGLVINGRLYRGARGNAGIIGVQYPNDMPRPSGQDMLESLRKAGVKARDFSDLDDLRPQTCPPLKTWIQRAAAQLRQGLWMTARILDPEAIIIGGRLPHHILQDIVARIDDDAFCNEGVSLPRPKLFASSLGPLAGVVGAAAIPLDALLLS